MNKDNKRFVIDTNLIKSSLEYKLTLNEFLLVTYFDNADELILDIELIKKYTKLPEDDIMISFATLVEKNLITVEVSKDINNKLVEKISLDNFYNKLKKELKDIENKKKNEDIFSLFEAEFGRTLSGMDYEVIKAWLEKGLSEELIKAALDEASYNGVKNLRYIDKILYEWDKKGIKNPSDINNRNKEKDKLSDTTILNFDWLDNE